MVHCSGYSAKNRLHKVVGLFENISVNELVDFSQLPVENTEDWKLSVYFTVCFVWHTVFQQRDGGMP
jgi:hypothetical protein